MSMLLHLFAKCLRSPENVCVRLQNLCVLFEQTESFPGNAKRFTSERKASRGERKNIDKLFDLPSHIFSFQRVLLGAP